MRARAARVHSSIAVADHRLWYRRSASLAALWRECVRHAHEIREGPCGHLLHHDAAIGLHGDLADTTCLFIFPAVTIAITLPLPRRQAEVPIAARTNTKVPSTLVGRVAHYRVPCSSRMNGNGKRAQLRRRCASRVRLDGLPGGQVDFLNQRWCEYTGLEVDRSYGRRWQAAIHPNDLPGLLVRW